MIGVEDADYKHSENGKRRQKDEPDSRSRPAERAKARRPATSSTRKRVKEDDSDRSEETAQSKSDSKDHEVEENKPLDEKYHLKNLDPEHPALTDIAPYVMPDTLAEFGGGFCSTGRVVNDTVAVPIRTSDGQIIGYAGREVDKPRSYRFPKNLRKDLAVFNLDRALASDQITDHGLIIVTDIFDVLSLFETGIENVVSTMGDTISDQQVGILKVLELPLVTLFVAEPDSFAAEKMLNTLARVIPVAFVVAEGYDDLSQIAPADLEQLLS